MATTFNATRTLTDDLSLTDALNFYITKILQNINTITLATIKDINHTTKRATVQPLINGIDSNNNPIIAPIIYDVPYGTIRGGNAGIITEYQIGDNVILGFCQRQIDATKRTKKASTPSLIRYHNLADAVIICAWNETDPLVYVSVTDEGVKIEANDQNVEVVTTANITAQCAQAEITATTSAKITTPTLTLDGNLVVNGTISANDATIAGKTFSSHEHLAGALTSPSGAVTGITGAPN